MTDSEGGIVWSSNRLPFGGSVVADNSGQNLGFPGQYVDAESGYVYNYYRDYDPSLGRYIQSDPIGLLAGVNTFGYVLGYVLGNPLSSIDPLGLCGDDVKVKTKGKLRGTISGMRGTKIGSGILTFDGGGNIYIEPSSLTVGADQFAYFVNYHNYDLNGNIISNMQSNPMYSGHAVTGFGGGGPDTFYKAEFPSYADQSKVRWSVSIPAQRSSHDSSMGWNLDVYDVE